MIKPSGTVIVNNIKMPINASYLEAFSVAVARLSKIGIKAKSENCRIYRRSVDARRRGDIKFVYSVACICENIPDEKRLMAEGMSFIREEKIEFEFGKTPLSAPPVIVGSGPAGLFAALTLAERGYKPILIERGGSVEERRAAIDRLKAYRILDPETNIQFGAGGAGTFSDGKLVTRVNDPLVSYVLNKFIEFGAPEEISYIAKPHIGTDILSVIVEKMLDRITELSGQVLYNTKFLSAIHSGGTVSAVKTSKGTLPAGAVILAVGHSARDTYEGMIAEGYSVVAKDMSVGMRIEHRAEDIDGAMYGDFAGHPALGHAEYTLSYNTKERGVYTFCMCPGGEVVAAASEEGGVVVNGMSENARDRENSNSAVVVSVRKEDYGATPLSAIEFQRKIEQGAFKAGGSDYSAPIISVGDLYSGELKAEPKRVLPSYMSGGVRLSRPEEYLPGFVTEGIKGALYDFDKKINGFAASDAVLTGAETRTSAPIRILRDKDTHLSTGFNNLYPAGEGAGYAGGITSASIDGIKTALCLMREFSPILK